jgi:hypothetical protein
MSKPITMLDLCKIAPEKAAERIEALIKRNADLEINILMLEQYNGSVESLIKDIKANNLEHTRKGFWLGFENARCHPDEMNILRQWKGTKQFNQAKALKDKS